MKVETAKKVIKISGYLYFVGAAIAVLIAIFVLCNTFPDFTKNLVEHTTVEATKDMSVETIIGIGYIIQAIIDALFGWVMLRAAQKKDKFMGAWVIIFLMFIFSIPGIFTAKIGFNNAFISNIISVLFNGFLFYSITLIKRDAED